MKTKNRCPWSGADPLMIQYHDCEWGVPSHDDQVHFEFLILEAAQAGLSWSTVLKKREGYRKAFANFDAVKVSKFNAKKIETLIKNPEIIRNRLKIESAVSNSKAFLKVQKEFGSFDKYIWSFVKNKPIVNKWTQQKQLPARSPESDALSADLKKRGFRFVGSTIIYAHMQAVGMYNDHLKSCFRYKELSR
jgi:DNA-3-methyladenine glycosylase I